jgi:hypothetical protein
MPSYSGLFDGVHGQPYAPINEAGAASRGVARLMSPQGNLAFARAADAMTTAAAIGLPIANGGYTQVAAVQADGMNQGGLRPISTYTFLSGNVTATQLALVDNQLNPRFMPAMSVAGQECSGYPVDKSGNGGGSKVGTL